MLEQAKSSRAHQHTTAAQTVAAGLDPLPGHAVIERLRHETAHA
jgi:hypothetical protein